MNSTPTPWYVGMKPEIDGEWVSPGHAIGGYTGRDEYDREAGVWAIDKDDPEAEPYTICSPWDEADARRIVQCVNSHDFLVEASERAINAIAAFLNGWTPDRLGLALAHQALVEAVELARIGAVRNEGKETTR